MLHFINFALVFFDSFTDRLLVVHLMLLDYDVLLGKLLDLEAIVLHRCFGIHQLY